MIRNIAIVYKTGGDFDLEYPYRLVKSIIENCSRDVQIYCLSDDPDVSYFCNHILLKRNLLGWWSKLELFDNFANCLYFDLDTIIRGNINSLLDHPHKFTMLHDFTNHDRPASGIMAWEGDYRGISRSFRMKDALAYVTSEKWGDQGYISERIKTPDFFQNIFPGMIGSFKHSYTDCQIVCFHGNPRPHTVDWKINSK